MCVQRMEIGDMVKVVDGWMVTRDVEAVKRRLLGPPNTLVTLGISRRSVEYRCAPLCHHRLEPQHALCYVVRT